MNALPQSIETALEEAGFAGTEILILRRLLEGEAMTVREIASKTGKSTGILDQSMKKLLQKGVVERQWVNDTTRYSLTSLDAVAKWMAEDMRKKHELMIRRHQNFETFISTLKIDKNRPEVRYYDGVTGIASAYRELLKPGQELLCFSPVDSPKENDPLQEFHAEYFRDRRRKNILQRVITHDTPLGRRLQSRDPFEHRQTVLVSQEEFPLSFEKIIAGDYIACFNHLENRACVMRYPELASLERGLFESQWRRATKPQQQPEIVESAVTPPPVIAAEKKSMEEGPLSTQTLSELKKFFFRGRSIAVLAGLAVLAAGITYGVYYNNYRLHVRQLQERALAIVQNSVQEIDPALVEQIHTSEDTNKPAYAQLLKTITTILNRNAGAKYVYIMRPRFDISPDSWEFVVDADTVDTQEPGNLYSDKGSLPQSAASLEKAIYFEPFTDEWGTWISAYAPIRDVSGKAIAVLGADTEDAEAIQLTTRSFSLLLSFVGLFLLFVLVRMAALHGELLRLVYKAVNKKMYNNCIQH